MIRPWLMTPYGNPNSPQELEYNTAHSKTRVKVENCIGILKQSWACLNYLRLDPAKACRVIYACVILHNRTNRLGLPEPDEQADNERNQPPVAPFAPDIADRVRTAAGQEVRARLTRENF